TSIGPLFLPFAPRNRVATMNRRAPGSARTGSLLCRACSGRSRTMVRVRTFGLTPAIAVLGILAALAACSRGEEPAKTVQVRDVTFSHDIAPILFDNCASCHRPLGGASEDGPAGAPDNVRPTATTGVAATSGSAEDPVCVAGAPFSVLDYDSVRRHARAIASAVQRRAMPPWLPEPGHGDFADERRLRDDQVALIATWVESGAPEGDPADAPKPPTFSGGWQLG